MLEAQSLPVDIDSTLTWHTLSFNTFLSATTTYWVVLSYSFGASGGTAQCAYNTTGTLGDRATNDQTTGGDHHVAFTGRG